jgi:hypothetical protein
LADPWEVLSEVHLADLSVNQDNNLVAVVAGEVNKDDQPIGSIAWWKDGTNCQISSETAYCNELVKSGSKCPQTNNNRSYDGLEKWALTSIRPAGDLYALQVELASRCNCLDSLALMDTCRGFRCTLRL